MTEEAKTYSVSLRLRRIMYEDGYVSVPVTEALSSLSEDGTWHLDGQKVFDEGVRLGRDPRMEWQVESVEIEVHPLQAPRPDDRRPYDPFYDDVSHA